MSALIGVAIVLVICLCGELANWVQEDDDRITGKKVQSNKSYLGAPMRKQFKTFDIESKKKKQRVVAYDDDDDGDDDATSLGRGRLDATAGALEVNLTPCGEDGTARLMSAEQLAAGACSVRCFFCVSPLHRSSRTRLSRSDLRCLAGCAVSRGSFYSAREKELESRGAANLSQVELAEMYTLQIRSASHEIAVRDRHLALLSKNVEEARAEAVRRHEETMAFGALLWPCPTSR